MSGKASSLETEHLEVFNIPEIEQEIEVREIGVNLIDQNETLFLAIKNENVEIVEDFLKAGCDPNITDSIGEPALFFAFLSGNSQIIDLLLQHGANVKNVLNVAIYKGLPVIVKKILNFGVNVDLVEDNTGQSPLHLAIANHNLEIVELLLEHHSSIVNFEDRNGETPLYFAVSQGNVEIVEELLKQNADTNCKNMNGDSLLKFAISKGNIEIAKELLKHGADVDIRDSDNKTPLQISLDMIRYDIVEILLAYGANIDSISGNGKHRALHFAAISGNLDKVKFLLKKRANINCVNKFRQTPLHLATKFQHVEVIKLLLVNGAKTNMLDEDFRTPFQYALVSEEVLKIFLEHANVRNQDINTTFETSLCSYFIKRKNYRVSKMIVYHACFKN